MHTRAYTFVRTSPFGKLVKLVGLHAAGKFSCGHKVADCAFEAEARDKQRDRCVAVDRKICIDLACARVQSCMQSHVHADVDVGTPVHVDLCRTLHNTLLRFDAHIHHMSIHMFICTSI